MGIPVIQPYLKESTEKKFTMNYSIDELMKLKLVCSTLMNDMLILKNDLPGNGLELIFCDNTVKIKSNFGTAIFYLS